METIVACRSHISDRFPVASFAIRLPPSRYYEVACATDPRLFHSRHRRDRTRTNFFTSREHGLLHAARGETAWMLPPEQLQRFAGARRVFYAMASYGGPRGDDAHFTIGPDTLDHVPSIALASDFTGRTLDRARIGHPRASAAEYGGDGVDLVWGGDLALDAEAERARDEQRDAVYDDGHDASLWEQGQSAPSDGETPDDPTGDADRLSANPPIALAIAEEAGAQCDDVPADSSTADFGGEAYGTASAQERDDEDDDEHAEGLSAAAIENDGDDAEDTSYGGYEDAAELYGAVYAASEALSETSDETPVDEPATDPAIYGGVASALEDLPTTEDADLSTAMGEEIAGRDAEYRYEEQMAEGADAESAIALAVRPLDIPEKIRLLRVVARAESGRDGYAAINADREYNDPHHPAYQRYHIGLSWGFVQFTQRSGALGKVLEAARRRSDAGIVPAAERFETLFGSDWRQLVAVTNAPTEEGRLAPVGGQALWEPAWTDRFRRAGRAEYIAAAQNEIAVREFVDPILPIAVWLGFTTPRAIAMLVDRVIHMGLGGGLKWVLASCGPLQAEPQWRRALEALGMSDLAAFQRTKAPHVRADNRFGPRVHAALIGALRRLGARSPIPIPDRDAMLRRLIEAAETRGFAKRLRALYENRTDLDDSVVYELADV